MSWLFSPSTINARFQDLKFKDQYLIDKYGNMKRKEAEEGEGEELCVICYEPLEDKEKNLIELYPCGHIYHQKCIKTWINQRSNPTCPECRRKIELLTTNPEAFEERLRRTGQTEKTLDFSEQPEAPENSNTSTLISTNIRDGKLDLYNKNLDSNDIEQIVRIIPQILPTTVDTIDLSYNRIDGAGASILASSLGAQIKNLNLWSNQIGDEGAIALASNTTLRYLNLLFNQIGDAGAIALASNTTLEDLWLGGNQIGDAGAIALASNTMLKYLVLNNNQIGDEGKAALREIQRRTPSRTITF